MATDMFLKISGVNGESKDKVYAKEIGVPAWSWDMGNYGSAHVGGGAGSGKVNVQDVQVTKYIDSASPKLMKACCSGAHYPTAILTVRKAGGSSPVEYIKIKMEEVFISSVSTGASLGEERLVENVSLNFAKVNLDYTPQSDKGGAGTAIPFGWDIAANAQV
jgi:type VI secretion system secreted protein Hcp